MGWLQKIRDSFPGATPRFSNDVLQGGGIDGADSQSSLSIYSGSTVNNTTSDFLGDWRAADSWQRFDMWRVRNRSRQLANGNPMVRSYLRWLVNNVLGAKGIHQRIDVLTNPRFGDSTEGQRDVAANALIQLALDKFSRMENFTTRKNLTRKEADSLLLRKLAIDGEVILQRRVGFKNDCGFAWQIIDPDYLDQNLNRVCENGNIIKMGVELDGVEKFPVAYWFLHRRPNDYFYNYTDLNQQRYIRVKAEDVIHRFIRDIDNEQTRGWPWIFASLVNLHRENKLNEAALVNAAVGASKAGFFKKTMPDGWEGSVPDSIDENGNIVDAVEPGSWVELPYGVEPVKVDFDYPSGEFDPFLKAINRGIAVGLGPSYASLTGDYSESNFSSSRMGQAEERETAMQIQEFFINAVKRPMFEAELYAFLLNRSIPLPLAKFDKWNAAVFRGRRWGYINPLQDWQAKQLELDNCGTSIIEIIEETHQEDGEEVLRRIARSNEMMKELGLTRITSAKSEAITDAPPIEGEQSAPKPKPAKK